MRQIIEQFSQDSENVWKLFHHMTDGLMITNYKNKLIVTNPAFEEITGYTFEEVHCQNPKLFKSENTPPETYTDMWDSLHSKGTWSGELINTRKDGEEIWVYLSITYIKKQTKEDSYYIGLVRDITNKKKDEQQIKYLAYHDQLTGLANRTKFIETLKATIATAQQENKLFSILFLDLDQFKMINDSFGHHTGDLLLVEVAQRLRQIIGERGLVSRLGGDEFTIILDQIQSREEVHDIIYQIFEKFEEPIECPAAKVTITASIGVSCYPDHGTDISTLLRKADSAMYKTKDEGKNNFLVYNEETSKEEIDSFMLENQLLQSLSNNQLEIFYQLQVDVPSAQPYGAEALIRWNHPVRGRISPALFLPIAEKSGFIVMMDDWVMKNALKQAKQWHDLGHQIVISVNISKKQFEQDNFVEKVENVIRTTGINPKLVCLEITESMAMLNIDKAVEKLMLLKHIGVFVSLDDFGTGYSSLSRLKNFPIDTLKIDQSFVRDTNETKKNNAIVKLIIAMAKSLNFKVICEGIETVEQFTLIRNEGCDHAQGFLFSEPMPASVCQALLEQMKEATKELAVE